jgi:membrane peptidoglycan carboxypeptidase
MAAKTGTSSAHRDAVAAGWNRRWTAVVWVGRFDGSPDPELLGADAARPILHDLLHHPSFATPRTPRPFESWTVADDRAIGRLGPPRVPEIVEPADGTVLLAIDGVAHIRPTIERGPTAKLFLDGRPVQFDALALAPGRHELRVVEPGREPHAITIDVVRR